MFVLSYIGSNFDLIRRMGGSFPVTTITKKGGCRLQMCGGWWESLTQQASVVGARVLMCLLERIIT